MEKASASGLSSVSNCIVFPVRAFTISLITKKLNLSFSSASFS